MSYLTVEVEIDHGRILAREPDKLPDRGSGLLTVLSPAAVGQPDAAPGPRQRIEPPLIRGDGKRIINPTPEELDGSLWGD